MLKRKLSGAFNKIGKKRAIFALILLLILATTIAVFIFIHNKKQDSNINLSEGESALSSQNFDEAIKLYEDSYNNQEDPKLKGDAALNVAQGYMGKEDNIQAKLWLDKSIESYEKIQNDDDKDYYISVAKNDIEYIDSLKNIPQSDSRSGVAESAL